MREFIESVTKVTFGGTVLLDHGELTETEPVFPQSHSVQVQSYLRADSPSIWDRRNVLYDVSVNVVRVYASRAAAMEAKLDHAQELAALGHQALSVEVQGGKSYSMSEAAIESADPVVIQDLGGRVISWTYSIKAANLTIT